MQVKTNLEYLLNCITIVNANFQSGWLTATLGFQNCRSAPRDFASDACRKLDYTVEGY